MKRREIIRLTEATKTGAVPRVKLLEREYAKDKLEALLSAQREALRLHGLSTQQIDEIVTETAAASSIKGACSEPRRTL